MIAILGAIGVGVASLAILVVAALIWFSRGVD